LSKVLIFGNSGSGKSTLAKSLSEASDVFHLDLDALAWSSTSPPVRAALDESRKAIFSLISKHKNWVVEGCYTDLLEILESNCDEIIFMNLPIEDCISNAKARPWEPHKYKSKAAQDQNLDMLIAWIEQYHERDDTFSYTAHEEFYNNYRGTKKMITRNQAINSL